MLLLSEQSGKSKHQEPLIRSESDRAAGSPSRVDCADHRKARRSCQISPLEVRILTTTSCLHRTPRVVTFYSNRWSCNSRLLNVHDTASFALGLMKDSARESLSVRNHRELASERGMRFSEKSNEKYQRACCASGRSNVSLYCLLRFAPW